MARKLRAICDCVYSSSPACDPHPRIEYGAGSIPLPVRERAVRAQRVRVRVIGLDFCTWIVMWVGILSWFLSFATSHAQITLDGTVGPKGNLQGSNYTIGADVGRQVDSNLFHSFGEFNVHTGESATFTGPNTIQNVIGRVTGGQVSQIDGVLRSEIPNANLYLLNPAGVLFGPNASLNVPGSFHISTADFLKLSDGGRFAARQPETSILTAAPPMAFGFLGPNPSTIRINQSSLEVPKGETLSVVGGDIEVVGNSDTSSLKAPSGQINLVSVASAGEVTPSATSAGASLEVDSFTHLGQIDLSQGAQVNVAGDPGGTVTIRGGRFILAESNITSATQGDVDHPGIGVDVQVTGDMILTAGKLSFAEIASSSRAAGDAGDIRIVAGSLQLSGAPPSSNNSNIGSRAFSSGKAGNVDITTESLQVKDGAFINSAALSTGNGGNVTVKTSSLEVLDGGTISAGTNNLGNAGNLEVVAKTIRLSGTNANRQSTGLQSFASGGNAGRVRISTGGLDIIDGAEVSTPTFGDGTGGDVEITADRVSISGLRGSNRFTGVSANTLGGGRGGSIHLKAKSLQLTNGASIQASTFRRSNSPMSGVGDAGDISVQVGSLELRDASFISSTAFFGAGGDAGNVTVNADSMLISGPETSSDPFGTDFTGITTGSGRTGGRGGDLQITTGSLTLTHRGSIASPSFGPDGSGNIDITADSLQVLDGSNVLSSAFGLGDGGDIGIRAKRVVVSGVNNQPFKDNINGNLSLSPSGIASQGGLRGGHAGDIRISADTVEILDGGALNTSTFGPGNGGNIILTANKVLVTGVNADLKKFLTKPDVPNPTGARTSITAGSTRSLLGDKATGRAGNIQITAEDLQVRDGGLIDSETDTPGAGGNITLVADRVTLAADARILTRSTTSATAGKAGDISITARDTFQSDNSTVSTAGEQAEAGTITIEANRVQLNSRTLVSSRSFGVGNSGDITINADTFLSKDSSVTTEAQQAGGGNIELSSGRIVELVDSRVTTTVQGGSGNAGNIDVNAPVTVLNNSTVRAQADAGKGGNITIGETGTDLFLASPDSIVSASAGPAGVNGTVEIRGVVNNLSGSLTSLTQAYQDSPPLAADRCAGRLQEGALSSFVVTGRSGVPLQPGGLLPSASLTTIQEKEGRQAGSGPETLEPQFPSAAQFVWNEACPATEDQP